MGSRILAGRYELLEKIGEGGMAVVFKAKDRVLNRFVAIKILRPEYTKDDTFIDSFRRESQVAASFVDPNIVNVYDVGKEGNIYYIVMELMDGEPLSELIKAEAPLDSRRAVAIARQIAMALSTAHKHHLIHRDVKPHNVLLTGNDTAKITDFGIAKVLSNDTLIGDQKEAVMGSIHYFSPEQARGEGVDERSDLYSLGIVLYEMVTGKVPFDGDTAVEVAVKHMNEAMILPSHINPEIPQDVEDIIVKATDKNPENRYRSADEMITDLSFVKFSKPSDYSVELEEAKESGDIDLSFLDTTDEDVDKQEKLDKEKDRFRKERERRKAGKRRIPLSKLIAIILAILLAIPVSGGIYKLISNKKEPETNKFDVPNYIGMDYEEVLKEAGEANLEIVVESEVADKDVPIGQVIAQDPVTGQVEEGDIVKIVINKGVAESSVPSIIGKTESTAEYILKSWGYKLGNVTTEYNDDVKKDFIISQKPVAGTKASEGTSVNIVVSLGVKEVPQGGDKPSQGEQTTTGTATTPNLEPIDSSTKEARILIDYSNAPSEEFELSITISDDQSSSRREYTKVHKTKSMGSEEITIHGAGKDAKVIVTFGVQLAYEYKVNFNTGASSITKNYNVIPE